MIRKSLIVVIAMTVALMLPILAQHEDATIPNIEAEIEEGNYKSADSLVQIAIDNFIHKRQLDTLPHFLPLAGKIAYKLNGVNGATTAVNSLIQRLISNNAASGLITKAYRAAADFFTSISQTQKAFDAAADALKYSMQSPGKDSLDLAKSYYNLAVYAYRLGNISNSQELHRKSLQIKEAAHSAPPTDLYLSYNGMGAIFWNTSKYDSALLMFNKAIAALNKLPDNDLNKFYRTANVQNNLAAVYGEEGKTTEAIAAMEKAIQNFQAYLAGNPAEKKEDATAGLFQAIDNLAGIYKEFGDYGKAGNLLQYSYAQKKQKLNADEPDIFISEILLGQYYNAINEHDKALEFLTTGLSKLEKAEGDFLFWQADGSYALAQVYENKKDFSNAAKYYEQSETLYDASYGEEYDNIYMDFLRNAAVFYATHGDYKKAIATATRPFNYLKKVGEGSSLQAFYQTLNIAQVNYLAANFQQAIEWSNNALRILQDKVRESNNLLDSAKMEIFKPKAILLAAKAEYQITKQKSESYLNQLYARLTEALQTLEKRKVLIDDAQSINILIADNSDLIEFAKKIELELYQQKKDEAYLHNFINLHESALYNRIRDNLSKEKAIQFANLPEEISAEEQRLKAAIPAALQADKPNNVLMNDYLNAVRNWDLFLNSIRERYPSYYTMRYGSIFKTLPQLQSSIPGETTLIRYFFVDSSLYALVTDSTQKTLQLLSSAGLNEEITSLLQQRQTEQQQVVLLNSVSDKIWKPLQKYIRNSKLIIVPDGILFNLSFDMLPLASINSFSQLSSQSLLSRYSTAYHFSLFMIGNDTKSEKQDKNYIAFVPGFSDQLKKEYSSRIKDSVNLDFQYLSLLPQPNTSRLARKVQDLLDGDAYFNDASTERSFIANASGHKIIHIGTHAEFNNNHPEKSRLIFAKNATSPAELNSLYLSDIYNCNVKSDLTILTACESGKPGFKDGEGMISLAHAFNYAGSKSILTSLWKLDEKSANEITELFIRNLLKKMPTDEALRLAKLQYLQTAEGRLRAPAYWAGMVLLGDPAIISLETSSGSYAWLIIGGIASLSLVGFVLRTKLQRRANKTVRLSDGDALKG